MPANFQFLVCCVFFLHVTRATAATPLHTTCQNPIGPHLTAPHTAAPHAKTAQAQRPQPHTRSATPHSPCGMAGCGAWCVVCGVWGVWVVVLWVLGRGVLGFGAWDLQGFGLWRATLCCLRLTEVVLWGLWPWGLCDAIPYTTTPQPTAPPPTARTFTTRRARAHMLQPTPCSPTLGGHRALTGQKPEALSMLRMACGMHLSRRALLRVPRRCTQRDLRTVQKRVMPYFPQATFVKCQAQRSP